MKIKTYAIMLSQVFPTGQPKAGQPTNFKEKLLNGEKIHTIRTNYDLWKKRIEKVQEGKAELSIRQWEDKPYRSKQIEIARLTKDDGVGIESIWISPYKPLTDLLNKYPGLAGNDGLSTSDWLNWFQDYPRHIDLPIIHFTKFRYNEEK